MTDSSALPSRAPYLLSNVGPAPPPNRRSRTGFPPRRQRARLGTPYGFRSQALAPHRAEVPSWARTVSLAKRKMTPYGPGAWITALVPLMGATNRQPFSIHASTAVVALPEGRIRDRRGR